MFHLKEITNHAWLVQGEDNSNIGLLSEYNDKLTLVVKGEGDNKVRFDSREDAREMLGADIFDTTITVVESSKENFVSGYPVDFQNPYDMEITDVDLPLYSKTSSGAVAHCAGYYVIHFDKGPIHSYCPKYSTISKYKYDGPFKTEMEMKAVLSQAKKRHKTSN